MRIGAVGAGGWVGLRKTACGVGLALLATAFATGAREPDAAEARVRAAAEDIRAALQEIQRTPGSFPAVSAVVVHGDDTPLRFVHGLAHAGSPGTVDHRSQFYIASQTKSFLALLAAQLDEDGVLPLDTSLAQIWPQLTLPAPADPAKIRMSDLLSHQEGLKTDTLNLLTAYVRAVPASDYPAMLARYTQARDPGFRYANIGDLIYAAALETRTGRDWKDWLQDRVLRPLRLEQVHSRSSRAPAQRLVWNHRWDGSAWIASAPKPDELMHAAGGLLASADDMAAWMRANLRRRSPTGTPSARSFEIAQRTVTAAKLSDGEFVCDGYSLGWYSCAYRDQRVLMHPGSYTGVVSATVLLPGADAGFSLVMNSDSAIEGLALELMKVFIGAASGGDESQRLRKAVADYPGRLARTVSTRREAVQTARAAPEWGAWAWAPSREELQPYLGSFHSERLGRLDVTQGERGLQARLGAMRIELTPARIGLFGAGKSALDAPEPWRYADDADSLRWNDEVFVRVHAMRADGASNP